MGWPQEFTATCLSFSSAKAVLAQHHWEEILPATWHSFPCRSSSQLASPHHHLTWAYLKSECSAESPPRFLDLLRLLSSSHWVWWPLNQTPGALVGAGRITQNIHHSSKEALGVSSERPASNKGEVPANVQEAVSWSCPIWHLWGLQKVAAGNFALKAHQEWRGMLSSHVLISFQKSIQKTWH